MRENKKKYLEEKLKEEMLIEQKENKKIELWVYCYLDMVFI